MRVLVIGGDAFQDPRAVFVRLDDLCRDEVKRCVAESGLLGTGVPRNMPRFALIYPDGSKAGEIADCWARKRGVTPNRWPMPTWFEGAGRWLGDMKPDAIVSYPGAPAFILRAARRLSLRVVEAT